MSASASSSAKSVSKTTLWSAVVTRNLPAATTTARTLVGPAAVTPEGAKLVYTEDFMGALLFTNGLKIGTSDVPQQVDVPLDIRTLARENIVMYCIPGSHEFEPGGIYRFWRKPSVTRATYTLNGETYVVDYTQFPPYPARR